jgi:hypothetical protein
MTYPLYAFYKNKAKAETRAEKRVSRIIFILEDKEFAKHFVWKIKDLNKINT